MLRDNVHSLERSRLGVALRRRLVPFLQNASAARHRKRRWAGSSVASFLPSATTEVADVLGPGLDMRVAGGVNVAIGAVEAVACRSSRT